MGESELLTMAFLFRETGIPPSVLRKEKYRDIMALLHYLQSSKRREENKQEEQRSSGSHRVIRNNDN